MPGRSQEGVTLIELMVVIAIIGVLATVATFMFIRHLHKARASEVPAMFAEMKLHEQQFHLENNEYLSTGADDADFYPASPGEDAQTFDRNSSPVPPGAQGTTYPGPSWVTLKLSPKKDSLYCGYVAISGTAGDDSTAGPTATAAPFNLGSASLPIPDADWFYVMAECDFDGDGTYSTYFNLSDTDKRIVQNEGE